MEQLSVTKNTHSFAPVPFRPRSIQEKEETKGFTTKHVIEGEDVVLPCYSGNGESLKDQVVHWENEDGKSVFAYERGLYDENCFCQDEQYRRRAFLFYSLLNEGNASMMLKAARITDAGNYTCNLSNVWPETTTTELMVVSAFDLKSDVPKKYVTEGEDIVLPCFSRNGKSLKKNEIQWKKTKINPFLNNPPHTEDSLWLDKQYRGRVSLFDNELKNGNASVKLKGARIEDMGNYTCLTSPMLPESSTVELIVRKKNNSFPGTDMFIGVWVPVLFLVLSLAAALIGLLVKRPWRRGRTHDAQMDMEKRQGMEAWQEVEEMLSI